MNFTSIIDENVKNLKKIEKNDHRIIITEVANEVGYESAHVSTLFQIFCA